MDYKDDDTDLKKELKEAFQVLTINISYKATNKNSQLNINYYYIFFG